ncbi:MAG: universal stress protein [Planctomycetes bacterium]|nr:universal stress protein [Planctomycetota bacterium]
MDRLKKIVVGVDFTDFSKVALEQAKRVSRWSQSDLDVLHVIDKQVASDLQKTVGDSMAEVEKGLRETAQERIQALFASDPLERRKPMGTDSGEFDERREYDERRIALNGKVVLGDPFTEVIRQVKKSKADLLVLGSNGTSDPQRGVGELAIRCVRKAPCRVLIVRQAHAEPFKGVVACAKFSSVTDPVIVQSIQVARQDHAKLHIVHVYWPPWNTLHYKSPTSSSSPNFQKQYKDSLYAKLKNYIASYKDEIKDLDVTCELIEGMRPTESIINYVEKSGAGLVVVGRGRRGMQDFLLGTQAERIIHNSPVAVLVVT